MDPKELLQALVRREEAALTETAARYGPYIRKIAFGILRDNEDAQEVENDVLLRLWERTLHEAPADLKAYLGMLSRQCAIDRLRSKSAARRGGGGYAAALEELEEALPDPAGADPLEALALRNALDGFLRSLGRRDRQLFLCRYWYAMSLQECAEAFRMSGSAVKTALHRNRKRLKAYLEREEIRI